MYLKLNFLIFVVLIAVGTAAHAISAEQRPRLDTVLNALSSKNPDIRRQAVESFGEYAVYFSVAEVAPIAKKALRDQVADVRFYGIALIETAIWGSKDLNAVKAQVEDLQPELLAALDDPDPRVRASAAGDLAYVKALPDAAEGRLLTMAQQDEEIAASAAIKTLVRQARDRQALNSTIRSLVSSQTEWRQELGKAIESGTAAD